MSILDYSIVVIYLLGMVSLGLYFQKKASAGIDSYFLGNRRLPFWVLGASGMASNLDVSGTMINVALIYALGAMGFFIEIRGGIVLIMAFLMIFMGKWNRRANVMTMAEWMELRFGKGKQGRAARLITAVATIIITVWMVTYFAVGAGKFIGEFLGFPSLWGLEPEFWAAAFMIVLAMIYTVASGLYGVVWTDVFQGFLILLTILIICFIAITQFTLPEQFVVSVPARDGGFIPIATNREAWTSFWPSWQLDLPSNSQYAIYNLFGIAILFYLIKIIIDGSAGVGGYMIQRFYASRSDRDAGLLSLFWTVLLAFRWPFIAAIAVMGISFGANGGEIIEDPEKVLPMVIYHLVPIGIKGLLVAGLMAAAMSTFDSMVNAGASYWVKDIYQAFINPRADERRLLLHSRWASIIMVVTGLLFTFNISNINDIWGWLTMGIGSGLIIPLLIRWYWWRLNGYGFTAGVAGGMIMAFIQRGFFAQVQEYVAFSMVAGCSLLATLLVTLMTQPTEMNVLREFYSRTRPFGFWKPIRRHYPDGSLSRVNKENRRDILATFFAVPWQLVLFLSTMMIVLKRWDLVQILLIALILLSAGLYFFWFRHLSDQVKLEE